MKHREPPDPSATTEAPAGHEDFVHRWSRRKAAARQQAAHDRTVPAPPTPAEAAVPAPAEPEPPPLTDADMPPLDTLNEQSDVSSFFSPGVSEQLRRMALRKIFSLARYNVRDGLNDYDEDYTNFAPLGDTVTADMKHQLELRAERERAEQAAREHQAAAGDETAGEARDGAADVPAQTRAAPAAERADAQATPLRPGHTDVPAQASQRGDQPRPEGLRGGAATAADDEDADAV